MANKVKKISINELEKCVEEAMRGRTIRRDWRGIFVTIRPQLSLMEMLSFVDGVVKTCFLEADSRYMPELRDFAIRCSVLEMYANFTLPENVEKRYELVYGCDVYSLILESIDRSQFDAMLAAIDEKIGHMADANIEAVTRQVNELYAALYDLEEKLSAAFEGIDSDSISGLVSAISDGRFDADKIMQAYMKAQAGGSGEDAPDGE